MNWNGGKICVAYNNITIIFANYSREAQRLREEQDREYRESMELERREQERREREERERIEAEEKKKQEEELAAAVELSKKLSREDAIRKLKVAFNSIPEPDKVPDAATIRFQLPRGLKLERRFLKSEPVQVSFKLNGIRFSIHRFYNSALNNS